MTFHDLERPKRHLAGKKSFYGATAGLLLFSEFYVCPHLSYSIYGKFHIHYRPSRLLGTVTGSGDGPP